MIPLDKEATKQHLISLLTKTSEAERVNMPAKLVQTRTRAKFDVPHAKFIKRVKRDMRKANRGGGGGGIVRTHRSGPDKPKSTTFDVAGGQAKAKHVGVDHYQAPAKLIQARPKPKFGPLFGGPGSMAQKKLEDGAAAKRRKANTKSDLQRKLFGVASLKRGWAPGDQSNMTGMQKDYLARNKGNLSSSLDEQGNFLRPGAKKLESPVKALAAAKTPVSTPKPKAEATKPAAKPDRFAGRPKTTPDGKPIQYIDIKEPMVIKGKAPASKPAYAPPKSLVGANYASRKKFIEHHGGNAADRKTWNPTVRSAMNKWYGDLKSRRAAAKSKPPVQHITMPTMHIKGRAPAKVAQK
jgi:hypothetical protein